VTIITSYHIPVKCRFFNVAAAGAGTEILIRTALLGGAFLCAMAHATPEPDPSYIERLRERYGQRIEFENQAARDAVVSFDINCHSRDGRFLPLVNVFLAKLAAVDSKRSHLTILVESRGGATRVRDRLMSDGRIVDDRVVFEINQWGELRSTNGKAEAVMNACFGSFGPIWKLPASQRK